MLINASSTGLSRVFVLASQLAMGMPMTAKSIVVTVASFNVNMIGPQSTIQKALFRSSL